MSLRAFAKFARFGRDLKDWTEIADVDTGVEQDAGLAAVLGIAVAGGFTLPAS